MNSSSHHYDAPDPTGDSAEARETPLPDTAGSDAPRRRRRKYIVNAPLVWGSALLGAIGGFGIYFWHAFQAGRNAATLSGQADRQVEAEDWSQAVKSLQQLTRLRPEDPAPRLGLARAFDHLAETPADKLQALSLYAIAAGAAPENKEIRARHLELLLEAGDPDGALARAEELLQISPADPGALRARALALNERHRIKAEHSTERVREALVAANRADPGDAAVATRLARFYREVLKQPEANQRQKLADDVMDALVDSNDNKVEALIARHSYRTEFQIPGAAEDLAQAVAADVDQSDASVALAAGRAAIKDRRYADAQQRLQRAVELRPERAEAHLLLGQTFRAQGNDAMAIETWKRGLEAAGGDDLNLQSQIAAVEIELGKLEGVGQILDRMEQRIAWLYGQEQTAWFSVLYALRADAALAAKRYAAAVPLLTRILSLRQGEAVSETKAASDARVYSQIGLCYVELQSWDQAAGAYQNAAELQPRSAELRMAAARLWDRAGWLDEAARQYEQATSISPDSAIAWQALADIELRRQLSLPAAKRDWKAFNDALAAAERLDPDLELAKLLSAESLLAQDRPDQAAPRFDAVEQAASGSLDLGARLAIDYERMGARAKADALIDKLEIHFRELAPLVLLRARLLVRRQQESDAIGLLSTAASRMDNLERGELRYALALLHARRGALEAAREQLITISEEGAADPRAIQLSIELDLQSGNLAGAREKIERLQVMEQGREDAGWRYYQAQALLAEALRSEDAAARKPLVDSAAQLQQQLETLRPHWAPTYLLKARLALLKAKPDENQAIQAYGQSIRLGERRAAVYQELISLLFKQNRIAEADAYLNRLRETQNIPPSLVALAVAADVWEGNLPRAIETARRDLESRPQDPLAHLRLGQLLALSASDGAQASANRVADAEAELKLARDLAPDDPRGWSGLLGFYRQTEQNDAARALLTEVEKREALLAADRPFFLAQGFALLGDQETAARHYQRAVEISADRPVVLIQAAQFFWSNDPKRAEQCLRQAVECEGAPPIARRMLAMFLAARGRDETDLDEAWELVKQGAAASDLGGSDRRLEAMLHLQQGGGQSREQARQTLEAIVTDESHATGADHLLLARLYEAQNQLDKARDRFEALVDRDRPNADYLAAYADYLLRTGRGRADALERAGKLLEELSRLEPESESFRSFALRARWLAEMQRQAEIPALGSKLITAKFSQADPAAWAELQLQVAGVYAALKLDAAAEAGFRRAAEIDPNRYAEWAVWLAAQQRVDEAVELCLARAAEDHSARPAVAMAAALTAARSPAGDSSQAQQFISRALERYTNDRELLFNVAAMRSMQGDDRGAIELLRLSLKLAPHDAAALNNLAMLLCETPAGGAEALACIELAAKAIGSQPELLDTKGWILLRQRRPDQAESIFNDILFRSPGNPKYRFHLALSLQAQGKAAAAQDALAQAERDGLAAELLSPVEQSELTRLRRPGA